MAKKKDKDIIFKKALQGKKLPILTLDDRWYQLMPEHEKTSQIKQLESELNALLKKQGKIIQQTKEMKKLKKRLMDGIVASMEPTIAKEEKLREKKLDKSQELIKDINRKIDSSEEQLLNVPYEIARVNEALMIESMKICYAKLQSNKEAIQKSDEWINKARAMLKVKIVEKQEMETENNSLYSYMHDILGKKVLDVLDTRE